MCNATSSERVLKPLSVNISNAVTIRTVIHSGKVGQNVFFSHMGIRKQETVLNDYSVSKVNDY